MNYWMFQPILSKKTIKVLANFTDINITKKNFNKNIRSLIYGTANGRNKRAGSFY